MKKLISNNTGEEPTKGLKTDIEVHDDGEGGIFLTMCWHEMLHLGSIAAHLPREQALQLIDNIREGLEYDRTR